VFRDLNTLHKLIKEYTIGKDEESWKKRSNKGQEDPKTAEGDPSLKMDEVQEIDPITGEPMPIDPLKLKQK
jgi:hypothetical protein